MISPFPGLPSEVCFLDFLDWTLTTTRAGLRSPTRTSSDRASVMVALKSPERLCFGKCVIIRVNVFWKPKSRSLQNAASVNGTVQTSHPHRPYLSASSRTSTSSSFTLTSVFPLPSRNSSTRPGVPIIISAPESKNRWTS